MDPAAKLELARAAVEFAEATLARERGEDWSASPNSCGWGGGFSDVTEFSIGRRVIAGEDVSELRAQYLAHEARGATAKAASDRMGARLRRATERYKAARRACGLPELVE